MISEQNEETRTLLSSRENHPNGTRVQAGKACFGSGMFSVIAGPCSVESEEEMFSVAQSVKKSGARMLRGGAFKPRTSPYAFQGLHGEGLRMLVSAGKAFQLPVISEITDIRYLEQYADVDVLQVGARNMQNFELLRELGHSGKPVLIKRGMCATIRELLLSAEYVLSGGNGQVILCERGIRTFETETRNTLDLSAVPCLHELTHLPVIVDPSHAAGRYDLVKPLSMAAAAAGADGLMIEVHNDPDHAKSDGPQSLNLKGFDQVMREVNAVRSALTETYGKD